MEKAVLPAVWRPIVVFSLCVFMTAIVVASIFASALILAWSGPAIDRPAGSVYRVNEEMLEPVPIPIFTKFDWADAPSLDHCGYAQLTAGSNDWSGTILVGSSNTCLIRWRHPYMEPPHCALSVNFDPMSKKFVTWTITSTGLLLNDVRASTINYICHSSPLLDL